MHPYAGRSPLERAKPIPLSESLIARFKAKVRQEPTSGGCLEWTGARTPGGYGVISLPGQGNGVVYAHRLALTLVSGPIPAGMGACHRCDNPRCVNADHLFAGSVRDNMLDAVRKGRVRPPRRAKASAAV